MYYGDRLTTIGRKVGLQLARSPMLQREPGFIQVEMFAGFGGTRLDTDLLGPGSSAHVVNECDKGAVKIMRREHPGGVVHCDIDEIEYPEAIRSIKLAANAARIIWIAVNTIWRRLLSATP